MAKLLLTSDGHADWGAVWARNSDIDVRREVPAGKLGGKVLVHVERVLVEVQFMTESAHTCISSKHRR